MSRKQMTNGADERILIAASGTGGHVFPALALAEQLGDRQIEWLGVPDRLEQQLVPQIYPLHTVKVGGLQGNPLRKLLNLGRLLQSIFTIKSLLKKRRIGLVLTTGGYIAAPVVMAAKLQGIPVIFHESNVLPGKVTRFLGQWCDRLIVGFSQTSQYLPKVKTIHLGTPVRSQFRSPQPLSLNIPTDRFVIVAMGGSQGAIAINQIVRECAPKWIKMGAFIVHLTGQKDPDSDSFHDENYLNLPFFDDMAPLLQRADFAISRSGASALTELAVTHTPSLLIPYPYAAENHQTYNAEVFSQAGGAILKQQVDLDQSTLEVMVLDLMRSPEKLQQMRDSLTRLAIPDSAEKIAQLLKEYL